MVSGLPSTQHIFLCSPSGNPPAVHAKESAEFYPAQSPLLTQMLASKPAAQSSSPFHLFIVCVGIWGELHVRAYM